MNSEETGDPGLRLEKQELREKAYIARNAQTDRPALSRSICETFVSRTGYRNADTVMFYLSCRSEVLTMEAVKAALLDQRKRIVVPYCTVDHRGRNKLGLWWLESLQELVPGMWNILEPPKPRWGDPDKEIDPRALDLIMVPGVAFDVRGGRLGNGQGYYDRLLAEVRPSCERIGVGFESQIFDEIPMGPFDVFLDGVITEKGFYQGERGGRMLTD